VAKTNISMPDSLLDEIDRRAADAETTRSGFIREAVAHYIASLDDAKARDERAERIGRASLRMAEIGRRIPAGPDSVTLIRALRDAAPRWVEGDDPDE
jgi:predicted DNA-binding protein